MALSLHNKLLTDIADMMEIDSTEYNNFVFHMTQFVPGGILRSKPNLLEKFGAMKMRGKLDVGKYESLKKVAEASGNNDVLEIILEREPKIFDEKAREQSNTAVSKGNTRTQDSGCSASREAVEKPTSSVQSGQCMTERLGEHGTADKSLGTAKKRKLEEATDQSDPLYGRDGFGRGKYDTAGKRGYLLILNYERRGLGNDIINLKAFFGSQLGFEVKTISGILTADDVWKGLNDARKELNGDANRQYYAFVCVILSHGNEEGILVKDQSGNDLTIPTAEISKYFCNSAHMKTFTGRPKLFFIQSCRGFKAQELHEVIDEDDDENEAIIDESDEVFNVPTDADTLVAFANTPGYATFGDSSGSATQYTCFIDALLNVFKRFFEREHVEDMLISVRETVALGKIKYYHAALCKQTKQMPCMWSTLTKRLYLTAFQEHKKMET